MSNEVALRAEHERAERWETAVIRVLPYILLASSTVITVLQTGSVHLAAALGLTFVATVWLLWLRVLDRSPVDGPLIGVYYAGLMVLCAGLVALAPWYGIFAFIGYVHAFLFLTGLWRYVGVVATSLIMAVTYMGGLSRITADDLWVWVAISVVSIVMAGTFFYFADTSEQHGHRQSRALAELHDANTKLETALDENAALHAQLLTQAREAGVLDERQRMAREIHDTLAQSLAGIVTQLEAAEQTMDGPSASRRHVVKAMDLARGGLIDARRTVHAVEPQVLADARLPDAIGDVARGWSETNDIRAVLTVTGDPRPMHTDVEVTLLRAAQEALANVAKHAEANRVGLTLSYMEDLVTLDVRDDGVGFDPHATRVNGSANGGFGLAGMRQRVQRLTGRLDIESEPGGGTAISASVPAIPAGGGQ
ncbi:sensor histidine kinase [Prescottella defluvii]|uniref:sensor histidine kinase n=1 Tax=Prescottella defluvii TaxID=1323361 RepID=UPI0004F37EF1|nr:sensor histidine kinase [Prescottella defluvii]